MQKLSLKKYRNMALKYFAAAAFIELFGIFSGMLEGLEIELSLIIATVICVIFLVIPGFVWLGLFFSYRKKSANVEPRVGYIKNWEATRRMGKVVMIVDGKEVATPAYFSHSEAKELVGKTVEFAVFEDVLFLFGEAGENNFLAE